MSSYLCTTDLKIESSLLVAAEDVGGKVQSVVGWKWHWQAFLVVETELSVFTSSARGVGLESVLPQAANELVLSSTLHYPWEPLENGIKGRDGTTYKARWDLCTKASGYRAPAIQALAILCRLLDDVSFEYLYVHFLLPLNSSANFLEILNAANECQSIPLHAFFICISLLAGLGSYQFSWVFGIPSSWASVSWGTQFLI